ncbi:MAG: pilin [Patescibacteria group bacterium]|nr:pilin [Patescibacteria group bacterium]
MKFNKKILAFAFAFCLAALPYAALAMGGGWQTDRNMSDTGLNNTSVAMIILTVLQWMLLILTFAAVIGFVIAGIMYITAGGSERAEEARKWLTYSIIGIIVALLGYVMTTFISSIVSGTVQEVS